MASSSPPFHPLPPSPTNATCTVHLLQAGGLTIPKHLVLLPGPNVPQPPDQDKNESYHVPDYVFLIHHHPSNTHHIFDLGMRPDLQNLPPYLVKNVLPQFHCTPRAPAALLRKYGTKEQQPENVRTVIFSHMHFDHVGDGAKSGFERAQMWIGPSCCTYARPGYPVEKDAPTLGETLPDDGSRVVVEWTVSEERLGKEGDKRKGLVEKGRREGKYDGGDGKGEGWIKLGSFDHAVDIWGDGSAYLIDAPGHSAGHLMLLVRVQSDDFVLLAGDCYHHPSLLRDPRLTARPPYAKASMHADPDVAIDTMTRTKAFAEQDNVWVLGAHDFSVGEAIAPGVEEIEGRVLLNEWREKGWKQKKTE
ncbi:hypothetical protein K491DRAFT_653479 [Lophiostoma macrostomum CBS 122681]|uniref:Uncharacterized protein n=1 Tax=Lophiostoma macrostomum CBS 122681 TaxID=1314788 RepID=A0A6A6THF5_9PLEO|nr:hypothetical protein K491DRAFT_653479 [Lophiostoma macrostomum CBS 122681]